MSVGGRAVNDLTVAHMKNAMAVSRRFGIVGDHHDGLAKLLIELAQKREDGFGTLRIQIARRLIGEDDFRLAHDRACERNSLLLAAGKLRGLVVQASRSSQAARRRLQNGADRNHFRGCAGRA